MYILLKVGKKGYVQLQTSLGNLNLELHCDIAMRTTWNFITLCQRGFYDGVPFHRLVPGFMLQGGDPSGTGSGGESAWGEGRPFRDEFDPRIKHDSRGVLSMANSGDHSNGSQFFLTLKSTSHLDYRHSVFGKLVGGAAVLDRIEAVGADKKERPLQETIILKTIVMTNPIDEADKLLIAEISANIEKRLSSIKKTSMPTSKSNALYKDGEKAEKYLRVKSSSTTSANNSSGNLSAISDRNSTDEFAIISSSTASLPTASKGPVIGKYMTHPISDKKQTIIANGTEDGREVILTKQKNVSKTFTDFSGW
jgi:peptidyl-prolyl cis-trans isomerase-like protein 2